MLNIPLYNALRRSFGEVQVVNENESAILERNNRTLIEKIVDGIEYDFVFLNRGEQYRVCCPYCYDTKYHLYVSHLWNSDVCVSGELGHVGKGVLICHRRDCLSNFENLKDFSNRVKVDLFDAHPITASEGESNENHEHHIMDIPAGIPINDPLAAAYIKPYLVDKRGFDLDEMFSNYGVKISKIPYYKDPCILFPIKQRGVVVSWQARAPYDEDEQLEGRSKYYLPKGIRKSWLLYNMDEAKKYPFVVLTEGVLDVIRLGGPGVCIFGKKPSLYQTKILTSLWGGGTVILLPDMDDPAAYSTAKDLSYQWRSKSLFKDVQLFALPHGKDPANIERKELWNLLLGSISCLRPFEKQLIQ